MKKLSVKIITALLEADRKPSTLCKTINCSENDLNAACAELIQKKIIKKKQGNVLYLEGSSKIYYYLRLFNKNNNYIGNQTLRKNLNFNNEQEYWEARNILLEQGKISLGKGKGGSISLVIEEKQKNTKEENTLTKNLLEPLNTRWIPDKLGELKENSYFVLNTSCQGSKKTGGKWSRPDLVLCRYRTYTYLPPRLEITTFEVKKKSAVDVTSVYEALSQNNAAHYSYVLLERAEEATQDEHWENILDTAQRHGIGVISFSKTEDYDTWNTEAKAVYHEAPPENIERFISQQLDEDCQQKILSWIEGI